MRPGQPGEVEEDHLRILDLGRGDGDGRGRGDGARRVDEEGRHHGARVGERGGDLEGRVPDFVHGDDELVLDLLDPEGGRHLGGAGVGVGGLLVALEEGDVGGSAADFGGDGGRGDGEEGGFGDGLALEGVAQDGVGVRQHGLGDCARLDEFAEILRQSWCVGSRGGLADERNLAAGIVDDERSDVHRWDGGRTFDAGGGREALGVDGCAMWDGCHTR